MLIDALLTPMPTQRRKKQIARPQFQYVMTRIVENVDVPRIYLMSQVAMQKETEQPKAPVLLIKFVTVMVNARIEVFNYYIKLYFVVSL